MSLAIARNLTVEQYGVVKSSVTRVAHSLLRIPDYVVIAFIFESSANVRLECSFNIINLYL